MANRKRTAHVVCRAAVGIGFATALTVVAPTTAAFADPADEQDITAPALTEYMRTVDSLMSQLDIGSAGDRPDPQDVSDAMAAAGVRLHQALIAAVPR